MRSITGRRGSISSPHLDLPRDSPARVYSPLFYLQFLRCLALPRARPSRWQIPLFPFLRQYSVPLTGTLPRQLFSRSGAHSNIQSQVRPTFHKEFPRSPTQAATVASLPSACAAHLSAVNCTIKEDGARLLPMLSSLRIVNFQIKWSNRLESSRERTSGCLSFSSGEQLLW